MSNNPGILSSTGLLPSNQTPQQLQQNTQAMFAAQAQQAAYNQSAAQAFNQLAQRQQRNWVINGESMTMEEFANTLWPEACADKTFFYLKYSKESE